MRGARWPGDWKAACHVCGFWFPSSKLKKRWDGVLACEKDWETRHPQTLIKVRGETAVPDYTRHNPDVFALVCDIVTSSGYAGLATAGCAKAGNNTFTYEFLLDFGKNGHENIGPTCTFVTSSGYANLATAGCAQAGNDEYPYNTLANSG